MTSPPMLAVDVRPARTDDASRVTDLLMAQMREHAIAVGASHVARKVNAALSEGESLVFVACLDAAIVGVAYVSFASPLEHEGEVAWLEELFVVLEHRERGVGGRLLEAVCACAKARTCVAVELETKPGHERAANLYRRAGFVDLGRTHFALPLEAWDWARLRRG